MNERMVALAKATDACPDGRAGSCGTPISGFGFG
jgi:hypothetical protein